jgi:NADPH2:quinone reductase
VAAVREWTGGRGVDVILDMVGGAYLARNLESLAEDGRLAVIAFSGGATGELRFPLLLQRRLTVTGSTLRARPVQEKARLAREVRERVWPLVEAGLVKPVVHATFPLAAAAEAHRLMESSAHIGKIVLTLD